MPLEQLGVRMFPDMFSLATAQKALDGGTIADAALRARFEKNLQAFLSLAEAEKHYPHMKRAWIELPGGAPAVGARRLNPEPS
jgi:hypothetical protein